MFTGEERQVRKFSLSGFRHYLHEPLMRGHYHTRSYQPSSSGSEEQYGYVEVERHVSC